jgi:hypothetical protein
VAKEIGGIPMYCVDGLFCMVSIEYLGRLVTDLDPYAMNMEAVVTDVLAHVHALRSQTVILVVVGLEVKGDNVC